MLQCPECTATIEVSQDTRVSEVVECAGCGCELEVVAKDPIVLALAPEIEEDWGE
ncbi:lysine biosynthesis protein LysW [Pendulispora albinea]|uniref:Lysine biosynthesis protein LysW n=1 Tax=Pendulispora albinea TaxID=2741071 RepID=A0ABZ2LR96_9BACT